MTKIIIYDFKDFEKMRYLYFDCFKGQLSLDSDDVGAMKSRVDELAIGRLGAERYIQTIRKKNGKAVLGFFTGGTSEPIYAALTKAYENKKVSFQDVVTFNMDEYDGLAPLHEQSYRRFMKEQLFNHVDIDDRNTHFPDHENGNILQDGEYDEMILKAGDIDRQGGGIGPNAHMAFVEPRDLYYVVMNPDYLVTGRRKLTEETRRANSRFFENIDSVPHYAYTMGLHTLMKSKALDIYAFGPHKAAAIKKSVEDPISFDVPASFVQEHDNSTFILDIAAASNLDPKKLDKNKSIGNVEIYYDVDDEILLAAMNEIFKKD